MSLINSRNLEEAIKETKELSKRKYEEAIRCQFCYENPDRDRSLACMNCSMGYGRLADWLEELKELREYKEKYRWHDLRKNPDDLPDVPHPESTWFEVVQEDNEACMPRAAMQYDDEYGFGFYQEIYAARSFGYVDTEFKTVEELNQAPVVAWKAIEEFESEEEDADINRK